MPRVLIAATFCLTIGVVANYVPLAAHDGHAHKVMGTITASDAKHIELQTP